MTDTTNQRGRTLLWVRPASSPAGNPVGKTAQVEQALDQAPTPPEIVHNVYHALVRLVRDDGNQPSAAVVCVDDLDPEELEFFTILARRRGMPPVYVYGHERSLSKLGRAVELGATGEANLDLVARLLSPEPVVEPPRATGPIDLTAGERYEAFEPVDRSDAEEDAVLPISAHPGDQDRHVAESAPPAAKPELLSNEEETASPPRVPWRQYNNGPPRKAPSQTPPTRETPIESVPKDADEDVHQPLLTDEELRALIGDDPTPLSPDDAGDRRDRP